MSMTPFKLLAGSALLAGAALIFTATALVTSSGRGGAEPADTAGPVSGIHYDDDADGEVDRVLEIGDVSPEQQQALADGYVTRAEYEAATWAAFQCLVDAGYEPVSEPTYDVTGSRLSFGVRGGGAEGADQSCIEQHWTLVSLTWTKQEAPSKQQLAASEEAMRACMVRGGLPATKVYAAQSFEALRALDDSSLFVDCLTDVSAEFNVPYVSE
jgi:hypothetical protein